MESTIPYSSMFGIETILNFNAIQLSAWCQNGRTQVLALYLRCGELVLCLLTADTRPVIRRIVWYKNAIHTPISMAFSSSGSFLLLLSEACHLYAVPALSMLDPFFKLDVALNPNDITLFSFPFKSSQLPKRISSPGSDGFVSDIIIKRTEMEGSYVAWYQSVEDCQQIGIIGTKSGEIIFVDLVSGLRIATTAVNGCVTDLSLCFDNGHDCVILLISTPDGQFELLLEQRGAWEADAQPRAAGDNAEEEPRRHYRGRLHGLKQMSVEKFQSIRMKIAETRAKANAKTPTGEAGSKSFLTDGPKLLDTSKRDCKFARQYYSGRYVVSSFHPGSHFLGLHSSLSETNPLFVHKMPGDCFQCVVTSRVIYAACADRRRILIVSSLLSEAPFNRSSEFNPDSILGQFDIDNDKEEYIIAIYKNCIEHITIDVPDAWRVDSFKKMVEERSETESCLVVTSRRLLRIKQTDNMLCSALRVVLEDHNLILAERICKIFEINLGKLLELAGDINLAQLKIPAAIAHFKLAQCGPLRITVKLAKLGHCSELLSYSTALLMAVNAHQLLLVDYMHISNLLLMSFVHQILLGSATHLKRKYLQFLETNDYFDKGLSMSMSGQSLIFPAVHRLITARGLIIDGFAVLGSVIKSIGEEPCLLTIAQDEDFWMCLSEPALQEAFVHRPDVFRSYCEFILAHLIGLSMKILGRLCTALDVTAPHLRPHIRMCTGSEDEQDTFPLDELVQLYLTTLLFRLNKDACTFDSSLMIPFDEVFEAYEANESSGADESSQEPSETGLWIKRKDRNVKRRDECETRIVSCGFGHTALIRNGAVYTWGLNNRGSLGHGPSLAQHNTPHPVSMFSNFNIQVSQVSCGRAHTAALTNNGVYTWGSGALGQLGLGKDVLESPHPRLVTSLAAHRVVMVTCGQYHTMCLTHTGQLAGCGWNVHGQLGLGTVENVPTPVIIHTLKDHVITNVACGHGHTLVLTDRGHVYSFGSSLFGQLGCGATQKRSLPTLVKAISGKVVLIATGYFHNLALTSDSKLYTWGASPQVLRLKGQAHKRARAMHMMSTDDAPQVQPAPPADVADADTHLTPSLVDTQNITGPITQIACGCHHYGLVTRSGGVYTWGRGTDGQLGNNQRTEVVAPTLLTSLTDHRVEATAIALGSDFSVIVSNVSGTVYAWGSNGSRRLGIPMKDTAAHASDGKVIVVKQVKRVVRLPTSVGNVFDTPKKVPDIPPATFTYQPLISTVPAPTNPSAGAPTPNLWHSVLHKYSHLVNHDMLLCKCLELGNLQAASKILLLRGHYRQAVVYQLKAMKKTHKQGVRHADVVNGNNDNTSPARVPNAHRTEMHPFTVQGGVESMCDDQPRRVQKGQEADSSHPHVDISTSKYCALALEIILKFLLHAPEENAGEILETGIQFWTTEKLPMAELESFLLEHLERVFYPLGSLLYLGTRDLARHFTADLQLRVTSRLVTHVENNGSCEEFVAALSKLLSLGTTSVEELSTKLQNPPQKVIHAPWPACPGSALYVFSCGHSTPSVAIPADQTKLAESYSRLDTDGVVDMACPDCVGALLSAQVA